MPFSNEKKSFIFIWILLYIIWDPAVDRLRALLEACESFQGVINFYALGGGTCGFATLFNDFVINDFPFLYH